jgi:exportin-1
MQYVDFNWNSILNMANQNSNQLLQPDVIRNVDFIIKVNTRVAEAVGYMYLAYLQKIFADLLKMYGLYSQCISQSVKMRQQESITKQMKAVRRDILRLIQTYISKSSDMTIFCQQFLAPL